MREKILKNEADFLAWKDDLLLSDAEAAPPNRYPCIANTTVTDWRPPQLSAVYKYREDIAAILAQMDAEIGT